MQFLTKYNLKISHRRSQVDTIPLREETFANVTDPSEAQFDFVFISVSLIHLSKQAALDVWRSNSNGVIRR